MVLDEITTILLQRLRPPSLEFVVLGTTRRVGIAIYTTIFEILVSTESVDFSKVYCDMRRLKTTHDIGFNS
jgi:hypothetical protein